MKVSAFSKSNSAPVLPLVLISKHIFYIDAASHISSILSSLDIRQRFGCPLDNWINQILLFTATSLSAAKVGCAEGDN